MRFATMLADVLRSLFRPPATRQYPFERRTVPPRSRGLLHYDPAACTGCALCVKDCPANALELITLDKANKRFALRYRGDLCTFCGQCVQSCRFNCIELASDQWELAAADKESFRYVYGNDANINSVVAGPAQPDTSTPAKA